MKTKTFLPVFLAAVMVFSLCGCGGSEITTSDISVPTSSTTTTITQRTTTTTEDTTATTTATTTTEATTATTTTTTTAKPTTTTKKPTTTTTTTKKGTTPTTTHATAATAAKEETWFEKNGFAITPLTDDLCFNDNPDHKCAVDEDFGIIEGNKDAFGNTVSVPDGYKYVEYYVKAYSQAAACAPGHFSKRMIAVDRYTGTVINGVISWNDDYEKEYVYKTFKVNGKTVSAAWDGDGGTAYFYANGVLCPVNYDGLVFAVADKYISTTWGTGDGKTHTLDEFIDFDTAEYYFFSASNK